MIQIKETESNPEIELNKERLSKSLVSLSSHLIPSDKLKMALEFGCSHATVVRYLNGEVRDTALATKLESMAKSFVIARITEQSKIVA